jgi:hypothetical protein
MTLMPPAIEQYPAIAAHHRALGKTVLNIVKENLRDCDLEPAY